MRAELDIRPEVQAELEFIESGITEGIAALPVQDTTGFCHQINWAIAYRLNKTFGWGVLEHNPHHLQNRNPVNPFISYVNKGEIFSGSVRRHHSFPLLIGVSPDILLIDGANDQADLEEPFLVAGLGSSFFQGLKGLGHGMVDKPPNYSSAMAGLVNGYPKALGICLDHGYIDVDQYHEALRQFELERDAGLKFLCVFNRDAVTHFMSALGNDDYPSIQPVQNALKQLLKGLNIDADNIFR